VKEKEKEHIFLLIISPQAFFIFIRDVDVRSGRLSDKWQIALIKPELEDKWLVSLHIHLSYDATHAILLPPKHRHTHLSTRFITGVVRDKQQSYKTFRTFSKLFYQTLPYFSPTLTFKALA
jgi:hypothetical protein